jgi:hypothetical protein
MGKAGRAGATNTSQPLTATQLTEGVHIMAENDSTAKLKNLIKNAQGYVIAMHPFFDLAEDEINKHNNSDFDELEFLINAAKAKILKFNELVRELEKETESEVNHV